MEKHKERTLEEINEVLSLAKLNENDVKPILQTLYFTEENLYDNNYRLLQLDSNLLKEVSAGSTLYVKGNDNDEVVICSDTKTFHVVAAETSNSLLLASNLTFSNDIKDTDERKISKVKICGIFYDYLEAVVGKPHLKRLTQLLQKTIYKGPEFEFEINKDDLLTFEDLNNIVQASSSELKEALESLNVVYINEKVRLLDFEYHFRVLSYMLKLIDENSWELDEIDYEETIGALKDLVPKEIVSNLLDKYVEESKIIDGVQLYKYKELDICKFFAQVLLHGTGKFNLDEFLQAWKESVPEGMVPDEEMLYGIAIIDRKAIPNVIWAFEESNLPENINERFKTLFEMKEKWTVAEISPYIQSLATEKIDVNAILAKYARASKVNGVKYYSTKHGK
ncbi:sister chromatid cohesion protein DCC1 [Anoplophora glabripennis]|uniref:sister chromatid cohesion protein DCC1 n=1 Tax=Anoplophora glabripennis TaxID=217634 RepID=UPI00087417B9|nr:sister chromatid cohesion protein DCC1 [Anoplophora glabripennis]